LDRCPLPAAAVVQLPLPQRTRMMKLTARIFLLLTGILLLAHYLPAGFWLIADKHQRAPIVFYSCVEKRFLLLRSEVGEVQRTDLAGRVYEREDFERLLPLDNYMQIYKDGSMPKEIDGVAITPEKLRRERVNVRLRPEMLDSPSTGLFPLLESQSGRVRLEMPGDIMRLGDRIEFLDVKANHLLAEKSARFRKAFDEAGFVFPVRLAGGNPSTLKPYDEGYFLVDSSGAFFHLRQVRGAPELRRLADIVAPEDKDRWTKLRPRYLHVQEQDNKEVRFLIVDQDGGVHLVLGKDYRLVTMPLNKYDPTKMQLSLRGDLLNRLVTASSDASVEAVVMDRDYKFVDRYAETLIPREARPAGRLAAAIFPFVLDFESDNSGYLGFHMVRGNGLVWGINLVLMGILSGCWRLRKQSLTQRLPELAAVGLGGLFGFLLVWLLPSTVYSIPRLHKTPARPG
jgi:hypothetical protein